VVIINSQLNQAAPTKTYLSSVIDELFANLSGRQFFPKLDMSNAYLQLSLDETSQQYVTINTHKGLFKYN